MKDPERRILLGRIVGVFGVRGEVKLESWTEPRLSIFRYQRWLLRSPAGAESEMTTSKANKNDQTEKARIQRILHQQ